MCAGSGPAVPAGVPSRRVGTGSAIRAGAEALVGHGRGHGQLGERERGETPVQGHVGEETARHGQAPETASGQGRAHELEGRLLEGPLEGGRQRSRARTP